MIPDEGTERYGVQIILTEQIRNDQALMRVIAEDQVRKVAEVITRHGRQPVGDAFVEVARSLDPPYVVPRPWWVRALQRLRLMERRKPIKLYALRVEQLARKG